MAVLAHRTAPEGGLDHSAGTDLPAAGTDGGPEIVVVVEPSRSGLTAELLGAAAVVAGEIYGHVIAFGTSLGDPRQPSVCGTDHGVQVEGAEDVEEVAVALVGRCRRRQPWAVLGSSTTWGREVLSRVQVRASAVLGAGLIRGRRRPDD